MTHAIHAITFNGDFLKRGFWLYVWEVTKPDGSRVYYVGRMGDSSSVNAQSPFNRMSQHLRFNENSNVLRRRLASTQVNVNPDDCSFRLVAYGPILEEAGRLDVHRERRDTVAALEKVLAEAMGEAGYEVLNTVVCRAQADAELAARVRAAFTVHFPALAFSGRRPDSSD